MSSGRSGSLDMKEKLPDHFFLHVRAGMIGDHGHVTVNPRDMKRDGDDMLVPEMLTDAEKEAVDMAGRLYTLIADLVVQGGPNREDDLAEFRLHIHDIQHAVMAQAAGRRYYGW